MVDGTGSTLWSKKIENNESALLTLLGEILDQADEVQWAMGISGAPSALLLALLAAHRQQAVSVPGRTVNRMSGAYGGEAKTDARDAYVIGETPRHRRDFSGLGVPAQLAANLPRLPTALILSPTGCGWSTGGVMCPSSVPNSSSWRAT